MAFSVTAAFDSYSRCLGSQCNVLCFGDGLLCMCEGQQFLKKALFVLWDNFRFIQNCKASMGFHLFPCVFYSLTSTLSHIFRPGSCSILTENKVGSPCLYLTSKVIYSHFSTMSNSPSEIVYLIYYYTSSVSLPETILQPFLAAVLWKTL